MPLYQGIIGGESSPVEDLSPVLVWTNPSPTSDFNAQTVALDLSEYEGVIIEANYGTRDTSMFTRGYVKKNDTNPAFGIGGLVGVRTVSVNDEGVTFGLAYYSDTLTTQDRCIPTKIYGVKKYVVEPVGGINNVLTLTPNVGITELILATKTLKEYQGNTTIVGDYITWDAGVVTATKSFTAVKVEGSTATDVSYTAGQEIVRMSSATATIWYI